MSEQKAFPSEPLVVTDATFEGVSKSHPVVVIDCWAPWCGPCRTLGPVIDEIAQELQGQIVFGKLNVDENSATAAQHNIMSIPTLLVFKDGTLVDRIMGAMPKDILASKLEKHL